MHPFNRQQTKVRDYFKQKFMNHLKQKYESFNNNMDDPRTLTSIASKKRVQIANELQNPAIDRLKQKLEERTLKNYENVLEDVRKQLTTYVSPEKLNPVTQNKVKIQ